MTTHNPLTTESHKYGAYVEAADPSFEQSWFHALHGLHDEAHHQHHDPLHVCVPVVMGKLSGQPLQCWRHKEIEAENERLRIALRGLAMSHHATKVPSKHHDPENVEWEDCTAGTCASARIALEDDTQ